MTDYLSAVLDELVPDLADEDGDWGRVVSDAGAETSATTADEWTLDAASTPTESHESQSGGRRRWLTRRRLVVIGVSAILAALLVTPAFGIGGRLLDLIEDEPARRPEVRISSWSSDGRRIAYVSRLDRGHWELALANSDGSGRRKLARIAGDAIPAWSPDGQKVAFEGPRDGDHNGLYVMNADGSDQRKLARRAHSPTWSPDGRRIAFFWGPRIYVVNAEGGEPRSLVNLHNSHRHSSLSWSPDGRKLSFLGAGGCGEYCLNLLVMDADGREQARNVTWKLTGGFYSEYPPASDPAWSPDGQKLAFARLNTGFGIYVVNADGSGLRKLTRRSSGTFAAPAWSPDGKEVAFVFDRDEDSDLDNSEVLDVNTDGTGQRNLTRNPANDSDPTWSPDGRRLAFVSDRDGDLEVYVMNADGSGQRRMTHRGG